MVVDFSQVLTLKEAVSSELGLYLHFHDVCGGPQWFNFDVPVTPEIEEKVSAIVAAKLGGRVTFSESGRFSIE